MTATDQLETLEAIRDLAALIVDLLQAGDPADLVPDCVAEIDLLIDALEAEE